MNDKKTKPNKRRKWFEEVMTEINSSKPVSALELLMLLSETVLFYMQQKITLTMFLKVIHNIERSYNTQITPPIQQSIEKINSLQFCSKNQDEAFKNTYILTQILERLVKYMKKLLM